ncbi:hypothetical protein UCDDS831_g09255 [Diplodia seriata]|uniref:Uncharacterized protein n=1 Tax=Diplodia seriata TaxID=420778 RepID=A0A0G2DQ44_9PEZI|nr:hypothetical protein UCDDS831_g09255 [Diplodia seriata]
MASNQTSTRPVNEELGSLLSPVITGWTTSVNPIPNDPNRPPIYPSYDNLPRSQLLLSEEEAEAYRQSFRCQPVPDPTVTEVRNKIVQYVRDIFMSMIDCRYALDNEHGRDFIRLTKPYKSGYYYPTKLLVAMSWKLMDMLLDGATNGFMTSIHDDQSIWINDLTLTERHRKLCLALLLEKIVVEDVLSGDERKIRSLVYAPGHYTAMTGAARTANDKRSGRRTKALAPATLEKPQDSASSSSSSSTSSSSSPSTFAHQLMVQNKTRFMHPAWHAIASEDFFPDMASALHHLDNLQPRLEPEADPYLDLMKNNKLLLVTKLYDALRDVEDIQNSLGGVDAKRFLTTQACSPKALLEACWRILAIFLHGVEHGFAKPFPKANMKYDAPIFISHSEFNSVRRFASMMEVLRREKTVAWMFVKSSLELEEFIADPYSYTGLRQDHRQTSGWRRSKPEDWFSRNKYRTASATRSATRSNATSSPEPASSSTQEATIGGAVSSPVPALSSHGDASASASTPAPSPQQTNASTNAAADAAADTAMPDFDFTLDVAPTAGPSNATTGPSSTTTTNQPPNAAREAPQWYWDSIFDPENSIAYPAWTGMDALGGAAWDEQDVPAQTPAAAQEQQMVPARPSLMPLDGDVELPSAVMEGELEDSVREYSWMFEGADEQGMDFDGDAVMEG